MLPTLPPESRTDPAPSRPVGPEIQEVPEEPVRETNCAMSYRICLSYFTVNKKTTTRNPFGLVTDTTKLIKIRSILSIYQIYVPKDE